MVISREYPTQAIKETEPRAIEHILPTGIVAGAKVDPAAEDALETVGETTIRNTVVRQAELIENSRTANALAAVPLTEIAIKAFRDQCVLSWESPWLFPSEENPSGHQKTLKKGVARSSP